MRGYEMQWDNEEWVTSCFEICMKNNEIRVNSWIEEDDKLLQNWQAENCETLGFQGSRVEEHCSKLLLGRRALWQTPKYV